MTDDCHAGWEISSGQMTELLLKEILKLHKLKLTLLGSSVCTYAWDRRQIYDWMILANNLQLVDLSSFMHFVLLNCLSIWVNMAQIGCSVEQWDQALASHFNQSQNFKVIWDIAVVNLHSCLTSGDITSLRWISVVDILCVRVEELKCKASQFALSVCDFYLVLTVSNLVSALRCKTEARAVSL